MSAIVGVWHTDGRPASSDDLRPLMDATAFYGGDDQGVWIDGPVALGFHMRHLTPLYDSMPRCLDHLTLVADARLDNREELFAALAIPPEDRATIPDSVLILRAYQRWGQATAAHLTGDFALTLWDAGAQTLYCARDHMGARPFYYHHDGRRFTFSTDLQALFTLPGIVVEPDEEAVIQHLHAKRDFHYHPQHTFYQHFKRLPFAHTLTVTSDGLKLRPYWQPITEPTLDLGSDENYFARMRELVEMAVHDRLRTDLPVGAHLSGGVDSSSVAILAARHQRARGRDLNVYSWSPPPPEHTPEPSSEHYRIEAICQQEALTPRYIPPAPVAVSNNPFDDIRLTAEQGVMQQAAADGVRVMLSGWGGDEFASFNGRGYRAELFAALRWVELIRTLEWGRLPRGLRTNLWLLWRDVALALGPDWLYVRSKHGALYRKPSTDFLKPAFAARVNLSGDTPHLTRYQESSVRVTQLKLFAMGHLPDRLEHWAARGAPYHITYSYPLLDRRLLEFVFRLPPHLYLRQGFKRFIYRVAVAPLFPPGTIDVPEINPKDEPAMLAHKRVLSDFIKQRRGQPDGNDWLEARADNPWVDTRQLQTALSYHDDQLTPADGLAVGNALWLVNLWAEFKHLQPSPHAVDNMKRIGIK